MKNPSLLCSLGVPHSEFSSNKGLLVVGMQEYKVIATRISPWLDGDLTPWPCKFKWQLLSCWFLVLDAVPGIPNYHHMLETNHQVRIVQKQK